MSSGHRERLSLITVCVGKYALRPAGLRMGVCGKKWLNPRLHAGDIDTGSLYQVRQHRACSVAVVTPGNIVGIVGARHLKDRSRRVGLGVRRSTEVQPVIEGLYQQASHLQLKKARARRSVGLQEGRCDPFCTSP